MRVVVLFFIGGCSSRALPYDEAYLAVPDLSVHADVMPILEVPDLAMPDMAVPDLADVPDMVMANLAMPDMAMSDLLTPDLAFRADLANADMAMLCSSLVVSTLSGNGVYGFVDGTGGASGTTEFELPSGIAVDDAGVVYVGDTNNNRIRKVAPDGTTTTLAGNGTKGFVDGTGGPSGTTEFSQPLGVALDSSRNLYVADFGNNRIRKVTPDGTTTTLAGNGTAAFADGTGGATGTTALYGPQGVTVDGTGTIYVADYGNNRIRKIAADGSTTTLAGNGRRGAIDGTGGPTGTAEFNVPTGVAVDSSGIVYVADLGSNRIRKLAPDGSTTTLAGNGNAGASDGSGGPTGTATFFGPWSLVVAPSGTLYVDDQFNSRIRKIDALGNTTTLAGGSTGFLDGAGCGALFHYPTGVALSGQSLFVVDTDNDRLRTIQLP